MTADGFAAGRKQGMTNREWADRVIRKWDPDFRYIWQVYHGEILEALEKPGAVWVDVGCGRNPHVDEFGDRAGYALGCDLYLPADRAARPFVVAA